MTPDRELEMDRTHDAGAPVIIFAYARADHLRRCVESLLANSEAPHTDVYFFCDAPKHAGHVAGVDAVRHYVASVEGFRTITHIERNENFGLARSVIEGVTQVLEARGQAIVLEDDLVLSPHFLRYMNAGLEQYAADDRVASIHAYVYPIDSPLPETFFLHGSDCWGWATWSRAWDRFDADGTRLLTELRTRRLTRAFDYDGQFPFTGMLEDQIAGRNSSWAILWHASCYLAGLLTLYPGRSLVANIGNDSSGTHCGTTEAMFREPATSPVEVADIPVVASPTGRAAFVEFFRSQRTWQSRLRSSVKRVMAGAA
ncbi:MAG: glycosyltransferase family A protein [Caldimonas sp.]